MSEILHKPHAGLSKLMYRRIILFAVSITVAVGVIVSVINLQHLYGTLKEWQQEQLRTGCHLKTRMLKEWLHYISSVSVQITSRSRLRHALEDYNARTISYEEFLRVSRLKLKDAADFSREVKSIVRFDVNREKVLEVDSPVKLPEELYAIAKNAKEELSIVAPVVIDGRQYAVVCAYILSRTKEFVGIDLVTFSLDRMEELLRQELAVGFAGAVRVVKFDGTKVVSVGNSDDFITMPSCLLAMKETLTAKEVKLSAAEQLCLLEEAGSICALGYIDTVDWYVVASTSAAFLYASVMKQMATLSAVVLFFIVLGVGCVVLLLRPLAGRLLVRTEELENEIDLKVKDLAVAKKQAEYANQAKTDFLATMSHEIRTPLTAIRGFAELLKTTNVDATQRQYTDLIETSSTLLMSLIEDILDIAKIETGNIVLAETIFNLENLIEDVVKLLRGSRNQEKVEMIVRMAEGTTAWFVGDQTRIRQVVLNFLNNALKFTEEGTVFLDVAIEESAGKNAIQPVIIFTIRDTGVGIADEHQERIFQKYAQLDNAMQHRMGGVGLGLAIVKALMEAMQGTIALDTKKGAGSTFTVKIPLVYAPPQETGTCEQTPSLSGTPESRTVAILDGRSDNIANMRAYCTSAGSSVVHATTDPSDMVQWISKATKLPVVLFVGMNIPGISATVFAQKIKEQEKGQDITLIAMVSDISVSLLNSVHDAGYATFLLKPIMRRECRAVLCKVFGSEQKKDVYPEQQSEKLFNGVHVLVVEDNKINLQLMECVLRKLQCEVLVANNGLDAIDLCQKEKVDIVLMDLQMPVMSGLEATRIIRQRITKDMPIIAVTAATLKENKEEAVAAGVNDFISKPIDVDDLANKMDKLLKK